METRSPRRAGVLPRPLSLVLGALLVLAVVSAGWMWTHRTRLPEPEPPGVRTQRQIRQHAGPQAELRYSENGQRRAVCGYIGRARGGSAVGFVSIPNRILFSDDPLPQEFAEMRERYCPGFLRAPAAR